MDKAKCRCCNNEFWFDYELDTFCMELKWLDINNRAKGFRIIELGHRSVYCPECGIENIVKDGYDAVRFWTDSMIGYENSESIVRPLLLESGNDYDILYEIRQFQEIKSAILRRDKGNYGDKIDILSIDETCKLLDALLKPNFSQK